MSAFENLELEDLREFEDLDEFEDLVYEVPRRRRRKPRRRSRDIAFPPEVVGPPVIFPFGFDRSSIKSTDRPNIRKINRVAREVVRGWHPGQRITIHLQGHTDNRGPAPLRVRRAYNKTLGQLRAEHVKCRLVTAIERRKPSLTKQIKWVVQSFGEEQPIADNSTRAGRAHNQRVTIIVLPEA